jgi:hypothetical protein
VLHAVEKVQNLLGEDAKLKKSVEGLIQAIKL